MPNSVSTPSRMCLVPWDREADARSAWAAPERQRRTQADIVAMSAFMLPPCALRTGARGFRSPPPRPDGRSEGARQRARSTTTIPDRRSTARKQPSEDMSGGARLRSSFAREAPWIFPDEHGPPDPAAPPGTSRTASGHSRLQHAAQILSEPLGLVGQQFSDGDADR